MGPRSASASTMEGGTDGNTGPLFKSRSIREERWTRCGRRAATLRARERRGERKDREGAKDTRKLLVGAHWTEHPSGSRGFSGHSGIQRLVSLICL